MMGPEMRPYMERNMKPDEMIRGEGGMYITFHESHVMIDCIELMSYCVSFLQCI